jgi:hypothetical protein
MNFKDFNINEFVKVIDKDLLDRCIDTCNDATKPAAVVKPATLAIVPPVSTRTVPPPPTKPVAKETRGRKFACFNCGSPDHGINECPEQKQGKGAEVTKRPIDGGHAYKRHKGGR